MPLFGKDLRMEELRSRGELRGAKTFGEHIAPKILVSKEGHIGILDRYEGENDYFHINDVSDCKIAVHEEPVMESGLFSDRFAGTAIKSMELIFHLNDFDRPTIVVHLTYTEMKKDSFEYRNVKDEIDELEGTLRFLLRREKPESPDGPTIP